VHVAVTTTFVLIPALRRSTLVECAAVMEGSLYSRKEDRRKAASLAATDYRCWKNADIPLRAWKETANLRRVACRARTGLADSVKHRRQATFGCVHALPSVILRNMKRHEMTFLALPIRL